MAHHLSPADLARFAREELPAEERQRALVHLATCLACRQRLARLAPEVGTRLENAFSNVALHKRQSGSEYEHAFDHAFKQLDRESVQLTQARASAPNLLAELLGQSPRGRRLLIDNVEKFTTWGLVELLILESERTQTSDYSHSEELAQLALHIASRLHEGAARAQFLYDLEARAWSQVGNARRISDDLPASAAAFRAAWLCNERGSGDPLERARLLLFSASLKRAQRDLDSAEASLAEAIRIFRRAGSMQRAGMAMVNLAYVLRERERQAEAIVQLERAAKLIRSELEPRLALVLRQNLAVMLNESGRSAEAKAMLPQVRQLALRHGNRFDQLRLLWLSGLVDFNLGELDDAERSLCDVQSGFMAEGNSFDVGLVTLDLACLAMRRGALARARALVVEAVPIFEAAGVARELLAALAIYTQATEREAAAWNGFETLVRTLRSRGAAPAG